MSVKSGEFHTDYLLLGLLGLSAVTLDVGVLGNHTVGRTLINLLCPEAAASMLLASGCWAAVCLGGAMCGLLSFIADCIFRPGSPISK